MRTPIRFERVGKKKIPVYFNNFEYYQPNDHICGDCSIRALSKALNSTWKYALSKLYETALEIKDVPSSCDNITATLSKLGWKWNSIQPKKGERRPTVSEFAKKHHGNFICRVSNHVVCAQNGFYYDIWDCGDKSLYGYWEKV